VVLIAVFFQQSGVIYTVIEDITSLNEAEFKKKMRLTLVVTIVAPIIMACGMAQSILVINEERSYHNLRILVGAVEGFIILLWYIISFYHFVQVYIKRTAPSARADLTYFFAILAVIWCSLFNIFWTFSWVTLGLLLDPGRVVAYFVAFLTVFAVAALKVMSLVQLMKTVEKNLTKELFKRYMKDRKGLKEDVTEITDEELDTIEGETRELKGEKLVEYFRTKGLREDDATKIAERIEKFRRFRVRFLIGNLLGTLFLLTCLIVFILLGVEAFRTKSASVGGVGSVLEGLAGAGTAVNDKIGDKKEDIQNLVQSFAKIRGRAGVGSKAQSISPNDIELATKTDD